MSKMAILGMQAKSEKGSCAPVEQTSTPGRNVPLDFAKGMLVLSMVLYHWINYCVSVDGWFYKYIRFVTPSFIFVSGFLLSSIYRSKYQSARWRVAGRLTERGVKLILVFVCLNLLGGVIAGRGYNGKMLGLDSFLSNAWGIFVPGKSDSVAFAVLLPIGYLLMVGPVLLLVGTIWKYFVHAVCVICLVTMAFLGSRGYTSYNFELFAVGLVGVAIGYLPIQRLNRCAEHMPVVLGFYAAYLVCITVLNVGYALLIVAAALNLLLFYCVGVKLSCSGMVRSGVVLLGKYTLASYIAQIAILQLMGRVVGRLELASVRYVVSFVAVFGLTLGCILVVDRMRARWSGADKVYKFVFA